MRAFPISRASPSLLLLSPIWRTCPPRLHLPPTGTATSDSARRTSRRHWPPTRATRCPLGPYEGGLLPFRALHLDTPAECMKRTRFKATWLSTQHNVGIWLPSSQHPKTARCAPFYWPTVRYQSRPLSFLDLNPLTFTTLPFSFANLPGARERRPP